MTAMHRTSAELPPGRRALASATRVLLEVEDLGVDVTGALVFGARERASGAVLVEKGRVCWIGAHGLSRRLTDLLIQQTRPAPDRRAITALYERCRRDGRPLGEHLVEAGIVRPDGLRRALLRHSVEALVHLSTSAETRRLWVPHRTQRYDAAFTFAPAELLATVASDAFPELAAAASAELASMLDGEGAGVALDRAAGSSTPLVVAHAPTTAVDVRTLLELATWTAGALDLAGAVVPGSTMSMAFRSDGVALLAWTRGPLLFGAACSEPTVASCIVARHARSAS